ncbi:MAG: hypothetical protein L3K23_02225 [Thermoplasmata archaeon]|nr:hypothetical protein [Thermoplasmata archaeon]
MSYDPVAVSEILIAAGTVIGVVLTVLLNINAARFDRLSGARWIRRLRKLSPDLDQSFNLLEGRGTKTRSFVVGTFVGVILATLALASALAYLELVAASIFASASIFVLLVPFAVVDKKTRLAIEQMPPNRSLDVQAWNASSTQWVEADFVAAGGVTISTFLLYIAGLRGGVAFLSSWSTYWGIGLTVFYMVLVVRKRLSAGEKVASQLYQTQIISDHREIDVWVELESSHNSVPVSGFILGIGDRLRLVRNDLYFEDIDWYSIARIAVGPRKVDNQPTRTDISKLG